MFHFSSASPSGAGGPQRIRRGFLPFFSLSWGTERGEEKMPAAGATGKALPDASRTCSQNLLGSRSPTPSPQDASEGRSAGLGSRKPHPEPSETRAATEATGLAETIKEAATAATQVPAFRLQKSQRDSAKPALTRGRQ